MTIVIIVLIIIVSIIDYHLIISPLFPSAPPSPDRLAAPGLEGQRWTGLTLLMEGARAVGDSVTSYFPSSSLPPPLSTSESPPLSLCISSPATSICSIIYIIFILSISMVIITSISSISIITTIILSISHPAWAGTESGAGTVRERAGTKRAGSGTVKARSGIQGGGVRWSMAGIGGWESPGLVERWVFTNPLFQIKQE